MYEKLEVIFPGGFVSFGDWHTLPGVIANGQLGVRAGLSKGLLTSLSGK